MEQNGAEHDDGIALVQLLPLHSMRWILGMSVTGTGQHPLSVKDIQVLRREL
jgi:hypothetical protein